MGPVADAVRSLATATGMARRFAGEFPRAVAREREFATRSALVALPAAVPISRHVSAADRPDPRIRSFGVSGGPEPVLRELVIAGLWLSGLRPGNPSAHTVRGGYSPDS